MNILLTSVGRRSYLVEYFKEALGLDGLVYVSNSAVSPAFAVADGAVVTPFIYDDSYIPFLLDYCRTHNIGLLISLFDIDLPVLSRHIDSFAKIGTTVLVSDSDTVDLCNDKWKTAEFLAMHNIPSPKTYLSLETAKADLNRGVLCYPVMIKPRWGMGSLAIYKADNEAELDIFYQKSRRNIAESYLKYESAKDLQSCVIIQEYLNGQEYGLDIINDLNGHYKTTIQKIKYEMRCGETDSAETVSIDGLAKLGEALGVKLAHRGNLDVDVFYANNDFYVLELNPRFGGGYPFSHAAGVNLPKAILSWVAGQEAMDSLLTPKLGVRAYKDIRMICEVGV